MVATHRWSVVVGVVLFAGLLAGAAGAAPVASVSVLDGGDAASGDGNETQLEDENGTAATDSNSSAHPRINGDLLSDRGGSPATATGPVARESGDETVVEATVVAQDGGAEGAAAAVRTAGGRLDSGYENELQVRLPVAALEQVADDASVRVIRPPTPVEPTSVAGLSSMNAVSVHEAGYDGTNATVAIVDTGGYDLDNPEFGDQVVETRDFSGDGIEGGAGSHGTKTAELAARTAPGADVVLVRIRTGTDLKRAVDWLGSSTDANVVSMSLAWANTAGPLDGTDDIDRKIGEFVADGGVWVTSSGNYANGRHWNGSWRDADGDGVLDVDGGESVGVQPPGSGSATVFVSWTDWDARDQDYDVELVDEGGTVLDRSTNTQDGSTFGPWERVTVSASDSNPRLRIVHQSGETDAEFNVFTFGGARFDPSEARQSLLIPAASPDVLSVGAVHDDSLSLAGYSSQGPTVDGRLKPEVVAPDGVSTDAGCCFYGTSAAAPHAAGVAALALGANASLTPAAVESAMLGTSTAISGTEPSVATGWGLVNATGAVGAVEGTAPEIGNATVTAPSDGWLGVGDELEVAAPVTDDIGVESVDVDAAALGAGTVSLTDDDGNGTYDATIAVGESATTGSTALTVTATDRAGNTDANETGEVQVDAAAPTSAGVTATDATDGDGIVGDGDAVAIGATVADEHSGLATVTANASAFGAGTVALTDGNGDGTYDATVAVVGDGARTDGDYDVPVRATDAAGNDRITTTGTLSLDTPPRITNVSVTNPDGRVLELGLDASESLASITASVDGPESTTLTEANFTATDGRYVVTWTPGSDGEYTGTLDAAVDDAGKDGASGESETVVVDTTPPELSAPTLADAADDDGTVGDGDALAIGATVSDAIAGVGTVTANATAFGAGTVTLTDGDADGTYDATVAVDGPNATTDGDYGVEIAATDAAGNRGTAETPTVALDTAPRISNFTVENPTGQRVAVGFDTSEPLSSITATVDGPAKTTLTADDFSATDGRYAATWDAEADGTYTATLDAAVDESGNDGASAQSGRIVVDTTAPVLGDLRLDGGPVGDGDPLTVAVNVTDATSGVAAVRANASAFGGGTVTLTDPDGDGTYGATLTVDERDAAADGPHAVQITATDAAGNEAEDTTPTVTLDTAPPSLSVAARSLDVNGTLGNGDRLAITATATDALSGVATVRADASALGAGTVTLTDADGDGTANATVTVGAQSRAADGNHAIPVIATDDAGNEGRATTDAVAVDTPPSITSFSLSALSNQRVSVTVESTESLDALGVDLDGAISTALTIESFDRSGSGPYTYRAVRRVGADGQVRATVTTATDDTGTDGTTGESATVTIDQVETRSGGGGSGGGGGGSGGGSSGGSGGDTAPAPPSADVSVLPTSPSSQRATVSRANPGQTVEVSFAVADSGERFRLNELALTAAATDYELEVAATAAAPDGAPALDAPVGFLTVSHTVSDADVSDATFRFGVDAETLADRGTDPESVTLLRQTGGTWSERPTSHVGTASGMHRFEATAPGLSVFAVATDAAANLSVTNATVNRSTAARADPVGVSVTVANDGPVTGSRTVAVTANGTELANETVRVPGGESRTITLPVEFERTGTYALAVDGTAAGTVGVSVPVDAHDSTTATDSTSATPTETETTPTSENDEETVATDGEQPASTAGDGPGFSPIAALFAIAVAGLALARRQF
ncbi:S8 family serine peptidase [Halorientalis halophila]|uniref:S8 family serine peptidase n=1 Tax=Halorientalis halophila TaxID=3108499 RepID=UPI003009CD01